MCRSHLFVARARGVEHAMGEVDGILKVVPILLGWGWGWMMSVLGSAGKYDQLRVARVLFVVFLFFCLFVFFINLPTGTSHVPINLYCWCW